MNSSTIHGHIHDGISAIDAIVAKALKVNELARVAKIETNLRRYIGKEWDALAVKAAKQAAISIRSGTGDPNNDDIDRMMSRINRVMNDWAPNIQHRYLADNREAYELSHIAAMKRALGNGKRPLEYNTSQEVSEVSKAKDIVYIPGDVAGERVPLILPSFNAVDTATLKAFEKHQVFWIGSHYKKNVSETVAQISRDTIVKAGLGREEAGKIVEETVLKALDNVSIPEGFSGTSTQYFEGLVANTVTTQRVAAQLTGFERFGYTKHTIINPSDHRTCEICDLMNGKVFEISDGSRTLSSLVKAKTPSAVKTIQPFMTVAIAQKLTGGQRGPISARQTRAIADRGNSIPPFHTRCRCSIDITEEEEIISF